MNFTASNKAVPGTFLAFAEPDSSGGVGNGGIWVSRDAGKTWRRISASLANTTQPIGLVLLPGKPFTVLFATSTGIYRSDDGGRRWNKNALGDNLVLALLASPLQPSLAYAGTADGIWKTSDTGAHWHRAFAASPSYPIVPGYDSTGDLYGYATTGKSYIYRVQTGRGMTRGTAPTSGGTAALSVDPTNPSRLYAAWSFPLRVYESNNSGRSWTKIL